MERSPSHVQEPIQPKNAEPATAAANLALLAKLNFADREDYADAARGFIATLPEIAIENSNARVVWSLREYAFLAAPEAPTTVNPSLWRQAQLNMLNGLFEVTPGVYQVRGFDLSNMTIVEGDESVLLIDPLVSVETAQAALELYYAHRPNRKPVKAVIYTHSHVDHYGGIKGVVDESEVGKQPGQIAIWAPDGFLEQVVSENVFAGSAMSRRATYMFAALLPRGERGQVDAGLGKTTSAGHITLIAPTHTIKAAVEEHEVIPGVTVIFQLAQETEAPSEMLFYFPRFKALCAAEDMTHNLHNLYTLRGAQVRNAKAWWKTINDSIELFGNRTDVVFAQHHWPMWGDRIASFLKKQRDLYKYIHDQSLRLMNLGETMVEIAEQLELPESLASEWYNRGYYGTVSHNAKAVYQRYIGWYDGNPANLHGLPPVQASKKYVEYMGGAAAVIAKARESFDQGEYRWVAQVVNHVVFADPENANPITQEAKRLQADALEQLGYQAESGPWRNVYLMGAYELRNGVPKIGGGSASPDVLTAMTLDLYFDYLGILLNGPAADGKTISLNWNFTDTGEQYAVTLENSVLTYTPMKQLSHADATLTLTRATLDQISLRNLTIDDAINTGQIRVDGDVSKIGELFSLVDTFTGDFNVVTP